MKNKVVIIFLIFLIGCGFMNAQSGKIFPYQAVSRTLNNGLKAILIPMENTGLVAYYTVVRTGSRDEWEPGRSGFAHFFEHMMFRGTPRFPGGVYDSVVTSLGADANAYTSNDLTVYHMVFAAENLEKVVDIESDRFRNLKYSLEQFQTESGAVYGEYRKGRTSPYWLIEEAMMDMAFDKHTYKHTTMGFEKDIKEMPNMFDYSVSFYNRYYRPENCVVVMVGDFKAEKAEQLFEKYYSDWQKGYVAPKIEQEPAQTSPRSKEIKYEGKALPIISIGFKVDAFSASEKNYLSLIPFSEIAFGETSEFYKKLVLKEQKLQNLNAGVDFSRDPSLFSVLLILKDIKDKDYIIGEVNKTLDQFKNAKVDDLKLDKLKKKNKYEFLMGLDSPSGVAKYLPTFITLTGDITVIDELYRNLEKVSSEDIQNSVKKTFVDEKRNTIILTGTE